MKEKYRLLLKQAFLIKSKPSLASVDYPVVQFNPSDYLGKEEGKESQEQRQTVFSQFLSLMLHKIQGHNGNSEICFNCDEHLKPLEIKKQIATEIKLKTKRARSPHTTTRSDNATKEVSTYKQTDETESELNLTKKDMTSASVINLTTLDQGIVNPLIQLNCLIENTTIRNDHKRLFGKENILKLNDRKINSIGLRDIAKETRSDESICKIRREVSELSSTKDYKIKKQVSELSSTKDYKLKRQMSELSSITETENNISEEQSNTNTVIKQTPKIKLNRGKYENNTKFEVRQGKKFNVQTNGNMFDDGVGSSFPTQSILDIIKKNSETILKIDKLKEKSQKKPAITSYGITSKYATFDYRNTADQEGYISELYTKLDPFNIVHKTTSTSSLERDVFLYDEKVVLEKLKSNCSSKHKQVPDGTIGVNEIQDEQILESIRNSKITQTEQVEDRTIRLINPRQIENIENKLKYESTQTEYTPSSKLNISQNTNNEIMQTEKVNCEVANNEQISQSDCNKNRNDIVDNKINKIKEWLEKAEPDKKSCATSPYNIISDNEFGRVTSSMRLSRDCSWPSTEIPSYPSVHNLERKTHKEKFHSSGNSNSMIKGRKTSTENSLNTIFENNNNLNKSNTRKMEMEDYRKGTSKYENKSPLRKINFKKTNEKNSHTTSKDYESKSSGTNGEVTDYSSISSSDRKGLLFSTSISNSNATISNNVGLRFNKKSCNILYKTPNIEKKEKETLKFKDPNKLQLRKKVKLAECDTEIKSKNNYYGEGIAGQGNCYSTKIIKPNHVDSNSHNTSLLSLNNSVSYLETRPRHNILSKQTDIPKPKQMYNKINAMHKNVLNGSNNLKNDLEIEQNYYGHNMSPKTNYVTSKTAEPYYKLGVTHMVPIGPNKPVNHHFNNNYGHSNSTFNIAKPYTGGETHKKPIVQYKLETEPHLDGSSSSKRDYNNTKSYKGYQRPNYDSSISSYKRHNEIAISDKFCSRCSESYKTPFIGSNEVENCLETEPYNYGDSIISKKNYVRTNYRGSSAPHNIPFNGSNKLENNLEIVPPNCSRIFSHNENYDTSKTAPHNYGRNISPNKNYDRAKTYYRDKETHKTPFAGSRNNEEKGPWQQYYDYNNSISGKETFDKFESFKFGNRGPRLRNGVDTCIHCYNNSSTAKAKGNYDKTKVKKLYYENGDKIHGKLNKWESDDKIVPNRDYFSHIAILKGYSRPQSAKSCHSFENSESSKIHGKPLNNSGSELEIEPNRKYYKQRSKVNCVRPKSAKSHYNIRDNEAHNVLEKCLNRSESDLEMEPSKKYNKHSPQPENRPKTAKSHYKIRNITNGEIHNRFLDKWKNKAVESGTQCSEKKGKYSNPSKSQYTNQDNRHHKASHDKYNSETDEDIETEDKCHILKTSKSQQTVNNEKRAQYTSTESDRESKAQSSNSKINQSKPNNENDTVQETAHLKSKTQDNNTSQSRKKNNNSFPNKLAHEISNTKSLKVNSERKQSAKPRTPSNMIIATKRIMKNKFVKNEANLDINKPSDANKLSNSESADSSLVANLVLTLRKGDTLMLNGEKVKERIEYDALWKSAAEKNDTDISITSKQSEELEDKKNPPGRSQSSTKSDDGKSVRPTSSKANDSKRKIKIYQSQSKGRIIDENKKNNRNAIHKHVRIKVDNKVKAKEETKQKCHGNKDGNPKEKQNCETEKINQSKSIEIGKHSNTEQNKLNTFNKDLSKYDITGRIKNLKDEKKWSRPIDTLPSSNGSFDIVHLNLPHFISQLSRALDQAYIDRDRALGELGESKARLRQSMSSNVKPDNYFRIETFSKNPRLSDNNSRWIDSPSIILKSRKQKPLPFALGNKQSKSFYTRDPNNRHASDTRTRLANMYSQLNWLQKPNYYAPPYPVVVTNYPVYKVTTTGNPCSKETKSTICSKTRENLVGIAKKGSKVKKEIEDIRDKNNSEIKNNQPTKSFIIKDNSLRIKAVKAQCRHKFRKTMENKNPWQK